jgi:anti-sigma28 factor (negative regulator of flagellin synthesis)
MQISTQEVSRVVERSSTRGGNAAEAPVRTVQELAAKYGVKMDEVRHFTERAMMADEDPLRERRVRELARRIADGSYSVEGEQIVEMAERRSIADQAASV